MEEESLHALEPVEFAIKLVMVLIASPMQIPMMERVPATTTVLELLLATIMLTVVLVTYASLTAAVDKLESVLLLATSKCFF